MSTEEQPPAGAVPLSAAIDALRSELLRAWTDADGKRLRFKVAPVELTVQAAVTWNGKGSAGVKWWLLELGGEVSHSRAVTQTVKLVLEPVTWDEEGRTMSVFVDAEALGDAQDATQPDRRTELDAEA
jgi:Trypsin-co-occurring domain 2